MEPKHTLASNYFMLAIIPRRNPKFDQTDSEESDDGDYNQLPPPPKPPKFGPKRVVCKAKKCMCKV